MIVVGAGLAGLAGAYELSRAGHDVIVLEARGRPGGRVETLRTEFSHGLFAEAGASYVADAHKITMGYITQFNLACDPVMPEDKLFRYFFWGKLFNPFAPNHHWLNLAPADQAMGLGGILEKYSVINDLGDGTDSAWPPVALKKYDDMSFLEFLRSQGASEGAIALMRPWFAPWWDDLDKVSALAQLRDIVFGLCLGSNPKWYTLRCGMDCLPNAFAGKLAGKIRYNTAVVGIKWDVASVTVSYVRSGKHQAEEGTALVCAVPFSTLRRVKVTPSFSREKQNAIKQLPYASIARVYVQCKERVWDRERVTNGVTMTDLPIMNLIDSTFAQPGDRGILHSFMSGAQARVITALKNSDRVPYVVKRMEVVYPGIEKNFQRGAFKCWDEDEWAKGAYACFKPGQIFSLMPHIARPEGRVYFAGDHTSSRPGWIEGALESGRRAATEVIQAA